MIKPVLVGLELIYLPKSEGGGGQPRAPLGSYGPAHDAHQLELFQYLSGLKKFVV